MNRYDAFFNKITNNNTLVNNLNKLNGNVWGSLSFKERINIFISIVSETSSFYPELGNFKFDFVVLEDGQSGIESEEGIYLNVKMIEDGNYFVILAAFIHELWHFYQRKVVDLYEKTGSVHELFEKEELDIIKENLKRSKFLSVDNYIESNEINDVEYNLQPLEYDAENFSFEFMRRFGDKFLNDSVDLMKCECANIEFKMIRVLREGNKSDIVNFNKIYEFNYIDRVNNNNVVIKREKLKSKRYDVLLSKLYYLNDRQIFSLLNPGLLFSYNSDTVMDILNAYLEFNKSETRIIKEDDQYYYNGLLFDISEANNYKLIEPLFLKVAEERIGRIVSKDLSEIKNSIEKDVKINMMSKSNFIKETDHPLLYRLQPSMLYRDMFVRNEYLKMTNCIDEPYDISNAFFGDFVTYIKKYDYVQLMKKAEILIGKDFQEIYAGMLDKMNSNINKGKKAK